VTYSWENNSCSDFDNVNGVIVSSAALSVGVNKSGVLPCLRETSIVEKDITLLEL
jgi:hypothetical protein